MKLLLGVIDVPYAGPAAAPRRERVRVRRGGKPERSTAPAAGAETTGDVATWLEDRYHVMEHFWEMKGDEVVKAIEEGLSDAIESLAMGAPSTIDPFGAATSEAERLFKQAIEQRAFDSLGYPGIPTEASLKGVNHRLKHPYAKGNASRPSFRDTGLYEASFKAWVE